jgi:hypothetical protein
MQGGYKGEYSKAGRGRGLHADGNLLILLDKGAEWQN